jgi:hypothetical protein
VIREVKYPVWLANTIPVKKKNGKWRMCVDFTDLNKVCKKDDFPLERVDKIIDDATNSEMLSLLDMFSGYHQIRVRREDEEKTSFITPFGTLCFVRMPEGLKNAGCTFSRMIAIVLHRQLQRNILAYVDDIVVKSTQRKDHISDLAETFANLRAANLRLNLEKCVFDIHNGKVLGCLVSTKGIEANPDKIKALIEMQDSVSVKDVQKLTGRVAALNRFIPRVAERSLPFFQVLRSTKNFQWSVSGTAMRVPKKPGESCSKPAKNTKHKHSSNITQNIRTQHNPRRDGPRGPPEQPNKAPPRARSASLEAPPRAHLLPHAGTSI